MMNKRKAFTLMEIVIAMALMSVVILSIFMINQQAQKNSMDAYYEMLAFSLAREPIEVYRGLDYETVLKISQNPKLAHEWYKIGEKQPITYDPAKPLQYPPDAENFQRSIELVYDEKSKFVKIIVTVEPKGQTKAASMLKRNAVVLESNIMERPKW